MEDLFKSQPGALFGSISSMSTVDKKPQSPLFEVQNAPSTDPFSFDKVRRKPIALPFQDLSKSTIPDDISASKPSILSPTAKVDVPQREPTNLGHRMNLLSSYSTSSEVAANVRSALDRAPPTQSTRLREMSISPIVISTPKFSGFRRETPSLIALSPMTPTLPITRSTSTDPSALSGPKFTSPPPLKPQTTPQKSLSSDAEVRSSSPIPQSRIYTTLPSKTQNLLSRPFRLATSAPSKVTEIDTESEGQSRDSRMEVDEDVNSTISAMNPSLSTLNSTIISTPSYMAPSSAGLDPLLAKRIDTHSAAPFGSRLAALALGNHNQPTSGALLSSGSNSRELISRSHHIDTQQRVPFPSEKSRDDDASRSYETSPNYATDDYREAKPMSITEEEMQDMENRTEKVMKYFTDQTSSNMTKIESMNTQLLEYSEKLKEMTVKQYLLINEILRMNTPLLYKLQHPANEE